VLFDRFNLIGHVPYVWTHASQGVLHGIEGFQDLTLAAKWSVLEKPMTSAGTLRTIVVVAAGIPLTNYNPELLPLSIGLGSTRVSWRGTLNFQSNPGWFVNGAGFTIEPTSRWGRHMAGALEATRSVSPGLTCRLTPSQL
jgi:hypothetical protein